MTDLALADLVGVVEAVKATRSRKAKTAALAELLERLAPELLVVVVAWLCGELPQGKIGVGPATVWGALKASTPAATSSLTVPGIHAELTAIGGLAGKGSTTERKRRVAALLDAGTGPEQRFLAGLLTGELRQGALAGVATEAVAVALAVPAKAVRRAAMLRGDLAAVAAIAQAEGEAGLAAVRLEVFRPLQPMLAQTADDVGQALASFGTAAFEHKLDGARIQLHKDGPRVQVFTRHLRNVTGAVPEVVELGKRLPAERVLDGEVLALRPDGRPHPFQQTMRRFGRKKTGDLAQARAELPLTPVFFDALLVDDELLDEGAERRRAELERLLPEPNVIPRLVTDDAGAADAFVLAALRQGHEGAMAKSLDAPWEAGARGSQWLKLKPAWTLDLVVLAVEWGSGRRSGLLSNLHLGARDEAGGFVMLGKTFKGLTDAMLAWQTERLLQLQESRDGHVVHVRPELVVEIAFNEIQTSPRYPAGLALRFARVKAHRPDKDAARADTLATVRAIHEGRRTLADLYVGG